MSHWLGVDVGGKRKRFDLAVIDDRKLLALERGMSRAEVVERVRSDRPVIVAIDSPCCCAPDGQGTRLGERELNRSICGIRWTPDARRVYAHNDYYDWIVQGLRLYETLAGEDVAVIEVFPTASWTRWLGARGARRRATWTRNGLDVLHLEGVPQRTNQDQRDAIAAAITARQHTRGTTETMGEIIVPLGRP